MMARANGYPLCSTLGYETPGSLGQYTGIDRKIPSVTIELRDSNDAGLARINMPALRAVLNHLSAPTAKSADKSVP
jgi:hypothetical protein